MSRRNAAPVRNVTPDAMYNSIVVTKMINTIMVEGKRTKARLILFSAFKIIKSKTQKDPLEVFNAAVANVKPNVEVKSRRVGGASYQVPVEVPVHRRQALALRWLVSFAKKRKGKTMQEKLAQELLDASQNVGAAVKKRQDTYKMAEANKAFAHYRW